MSLDTTVLFSSDSSEILLNWLIKVLSVMFSAVMAAGWTGWIMGRLGGGMWLTRYVNLAEGGVHTNMVWTIL